MFINNYQASLTFTDLLKAIGEKEKILKETKYILFELIE